MRISDWSSDVCSSDLSIPLKSVVIAYGYNTNARIGHCLNHCLGLETLPETFHPCLVTIHSRCHVSHRHCHLSPTQVQQAVLIAAAAGLPCNAANPTRATQNSPLNRIKRKQLGTGE